MNYQKIYDSIVARAKNGLRIKGAEIYYEQHHIKPRCLGGDDSRDNLVLLTGREHFICHRLLYKIHPANFKIISAFWGMCNQQKGKRKKSYIPSSRAYEEARRAFSNALGKVRLGKNNPMFGREGVMKGKHHTEEAREKMSAAKKGKPSPRKGKPGKSLTQAQKDYLSSLHTGIPKSEGTRQKMRKPKAKTTCPHCRIVGGVGSLKRYHFEKCKLKTDYLLS